MNQFKVYPVLFLFFFTVTDFGYAQENRESLSATQLLEAMFDSVYTIKSTRFEMFSKERVAGELVSSHAKGIINFSPRKVFLRGFDEDGVLLNEILFVAGENNDNALISPNGFPYININLDPVGSTMRRNRHFTILEAGGRHLVDMLKLGMTEYAKRGNVADRFALLDGESNTLKVVITNADYALITQQVPKDQDLRTFARSLGVPEYKLIELNEDISGFDEVLETGEMVIVPNLYAKRVELTLRNSDLIPMEVRIFDEKGLYSEYVYTLFDTHPEIDSATFNSDNPAYTF